MSGLVAVTGAGGFLGARLVARLRADGRPVRRLVRRPEGPDDAPFVLGEPVSPDALRGADALIHCAHDFAARGAELRRRNVDGSLHLLDAARAAGVRRLVFVSSVSAFEGCASEYGKAKLEVEAGARALGAAVVRPGLCWGVPGRGTFGALVRLTALPVLPVFDGGRQPFVLCHADDAAAALAAAVDAPVPAAPALAAHPRLVAFRDLLAEIAALRGRTLSTVSLPGTLGLAGLRTLEALGLTPPFRSDSLLSLLRTDPDPVRSAPASYGTAFRDLSAARPDEL
ncbi:MAG: NAD-dependent epimerase/dehydratase family protein [Elusimicrobia bacterium]|nr:NAD-dependent epimerase/dehydratase family protein [Elusimicrobiota bacterium]